MEEILSKKAKDICNNLNTTASESFNEFAKDRLFNNPEENKTRFVHFGMNILSGLKDLQTEVEKNMIRDLEIRPVVNPKVRFDFLLNLLAGNEVEESKQQMSEITDRLIDGNEEKQETIYDDLDLQRTQINRLIEREMYWN